MKVIFEQFLNHVRGAWRFRWWGLLLAWVICLVGWVMVLCLPDRYEASARVFVDTRTALSRATEGLAVNTDIDSQIDRVREALLGGPQLEEVARKEGLQLVGATPRERQDVISGLRERIQINPRGAGLYVISYTNASRERSLGVVTLILNHFVEDSLGGKREGSEQAQKFLVDQIADYERRLGAAEDRLAEFKKKNVGLLPGTQSDYFSRLQAEMEALSKAQGDLSVAQRQREELQRQARGEAVLGAMGGSAAAATSRTATAGGAATIGSAGTAGGAVGDNDIANRIRETQARLDDLLLRFTDKHPDVVALRATLAELKARQQSEIDAIQHGDTAAAARIGLGANPVYQNIQLQLNQQDVEIAALRGKIAESQGRIANFKLLVNTAPEVEAEYSRLNRDYDVTRTEYQALVQRLEQSRLSQQAEETGIVRFEVIDPPNSPFKPVWPNRPLFLFAVLVLAWVAAALLTYLLDQLKPVFNNVRELNEITGLPVLGAVSMTWLEKHRANDRYRTVLYAGAASLLFVLAAAVLVLQSPAKRLLQHWVGLA